MKKIVFVVAFVSFLSGCAAMFNGASQQVSIRSQDTRAKIYVNEAYLGNGHVVTTFKKKKNYTIRVEQEDCESMSVPVTKSFDATTLLGVFIDFGIVTILVVDGVGTGAWQSFDQTNYIIDAKCSTQISSL